MWSRKRREITNFPNSRISHPGEIGVLIKLHLPCYGAERKWVCGCIGVAMWMMIKYGKEFQFDKQQKLRDRFIFFSFLIIDQELSFKMTFWE